MVDRSRQLALARQLRREPPATERLLWRLLRDRRLEGLKFRRQVPIGRYVVDFVCLRHRLVIEADGPHHQDSPTDPLRDAWLIGQGFRVLRFVNGEIQGYPDRVLGLILEAVAAPPCDPSPDPLRGPPSPARGEGN
jgi:very-short-patch-repair endonuclease